MQFSNIFNRKGKEVMKEAMDYVDAILKSNENLRERLNNYNKDEEIQKMKEEIIQVKERSIYYMNEKERKQAHEFRRSHREKCEAAFAYITTETGIGTGLTIRCEKCYEEKNITDYDTW